MTKCFVHLYGYSIAMYIHTTPISINWWEQAMHPTTTVDKWDFVETLGIGIIGVYLNSNREGLKKDTWFFYNELGQWAGNGKGKGRTFNTVSQG